MYTSTSNADVSKATAMPCQSQTTKWRTPAQQPANTVVYDTPETPDQQSTVKKRQLLFNNDGFIVPAPVFRTPRETPERNGLVRSFEQDNETASSSSSGTLQLQTQISKSLQLDFGAHHNYNALPTPPQTVSASKQTPTHLANDACLNTPLFSRGTEDDIMEIDNYLSTPVSIRNTEHSHRQYTPMEVAKKGPLSLETLPPELTFKILKQLSPHDLARASSVSQAWRFMVDNNDLWQPHVQKTSRKYSMNFSGSPSLKEMYSNLMNYEKRLRTQKKNISMQREQIDSSVRQYTPHYNNYRFGSMTDLHAASPSWAKLQRRFRELSPTSVEQERENIVTPDDMARARLGSFAHSTLEERSGDSYYSSPPRRLNLGVPLRDIGNEMVEDNLSSPTHGTRSVSSTSNSRALFSTSTSFIANRSTNRNTNVRAKDSTLSGSRGALGSVSAASPDDMRVPSKKNVICGKSSKRRLKRL
eukprot:CFRG5117T1